MDTEALLRVIKPGDVLGFSGGDRVSRGIQVGTLSWPFARPLAWRGLSHVEIVARLPFTDRLISYCSTTLCQEPCIIKRERCSGVQAHEIADRIRWYHDRGGVAWHYPLATPLTPRAERELTAFCFAHAKAGTKYDYLGAFDSRSTALAMAHRLMLGKEDLSAFFCSEFCAAALRDAGVWQITNVSGLNPNSFARRAVRDGVLLFPGQIVPARAA